MVKAVQVFGLIWHLFIHSFILIYIWLFILFVCFFNLFNISRQLLLFFCTTRILYGSNASNLILFHHFKLLSARPCAWAFGWVLQLMLYYNMKNVKIDCSQWEYRKLMVNLKFAPMSLQSNLVNTGTERAIANVHIKRVEFRENVRALFSQGGVCFKPVPLRWLRHYYWSI